MGASRRTSTRTTLPTALPDIDCGDTVTNTYVYVLKREFRGSSCPRSSSPACRSTATSRRCSRSPGTSSPAATEVRFITGARFADGGRRHRRDAVPLAGRRRLRRPRGPRRAFPDRAGLKGIKALAFDIEHIFTRPAQAQYDAVMAAHAAEPADAVLTDPAFAGGAFVLGHARPSVRPSSCAACSRCRWPAATPPRTGSGCRRRSGSTARATPRSRRSLAGSSAAPPASPTGCTATCTASPCRSRRSTGAGHADAVVQFTVPAFEYPRSDAPATLHFAGPLSATGSQAPRPSWWADLDGGRPVVHVTQGTIANKDFGQLVGPTLEALADDDVLVVVSTGGRPLDTLPPLPANARAAEYLPYDELLPRTDVFVTNGGYGGVQYALRYGVPIVATGGKEDKPEVGAASRGRASAGGSAPSTRAQGLRRDIPPCCRAALPRRQPAHRRRHGRGPGLDGLTDVVDQLVASPERLPAEN